MPAATGQGRRRLIAVAHGSRQLIARKNYGYRAVSLSRYGLNLLRQLTRPLTPPEDPLARMVETILNWIAKQLARDQLLKIVRQSGLRFNPQ